MTAINPVAPTSASPNPPVPSGGQDQAWIGGNMPFARFGLIVNLLVPIALLIWDAMHHVLGADPVNFALHTTGFIALLYLLLSLGVTPLRTLSGFSWLIQFRRSLGVYAFYYAAAHLAIYFWWDEQASLSATVHEIVHRYYLAIGFTSLALMTPLWATSFNAAIRKLGGRNWKRLHRLAYLAAVLGCIHYYMQSKADKRVPDLFFAVLAGLFAWRIGAAMTQSARLRGKTVSAPDTPGRGKLRFWKGQMRVIDMIRETPTVRTFRLAPVDGSSLPFSFSAGQFINLALEIDGRRVSRSYTIASSPRQDRYIELTVKREENGQVSQYLHDKLMNGHAVEISGPNGRFTFDPASEKSVLLIAGGVGITPVMSILRSLTDASWAGQIDLVLSVRSPAEVIFAQELRSLAERNPNLHVHITVTREQPPEWTGLRGRITVDLLRKLAADFTERRALICGPDEMARGIREQMVSAGAAPQRITLESFTPGAAVVTPEQEEDSNVATAIATNVTFTKSGRTAPLAAAQSILEAAESVGVRIDYDCRSGICGQCRCKLLRGQVTMEVRDALSDADEADGFILACQAHATADCEIEA